MFPALIHAIILLSLTLQGQDNSDTQNAMKGLVNAHNAWGAKMSSPNTSLEIKESSRSGNEMKFRLRAKGMPRDKIYTIVQWPVTHNDPVAIIRGVTLDATGQAVCAGTAGTCSSDEPNDPIDILVLPVAGEPLRLGLVSEDGDTRVLGKIVPVPLRGEDRGCSIEGVLLTPAAELVLVTGSGFPAGSELTMDADSEGEHHSAKVKAGTDGQYMTALGPYKQGVSRGTAKVTLKSAGCSPTVTIPWGHN